MRSTDSLIEPSNCTNYRPEKIGKGERERTENRCCLEDLERNRMIRNGFCGNAHCPFFKPVGQADSVRVDTLGKTWFVPLSDEQKAKQIPQDEYYEHYERVKFMNDKVIKTIEWVIQQMIDNLDMTREEAIEQIEQFCQERW